MAPIKGPILDWLPGESLYSLVARNHQYLGYQRPAEIVKVFFGSPTGKSLQIGMTEADVFVARTEGTLGAGSAILEERTLLRFYRLFTAEQDMHKLLKGEPGTDSMLKFPMALWTGRVKTMHPLKACTICVDNDRTNIGMPYWRLDHQYPGVWVCLEHDHPLQESTVKPMASQRFLWQMPSDERVHPMPAAMACAEYRSRLTDLSKLIVTLASDAAHGAARLREGWVWFGRYLSNAGLLTSSGRLSTVMKGGVLVLCERWVDFASSLRILPEFSKLPWGTDQAHRQLSRYVNGKSPISPMEQVALMLWFNTLDRCLVS